MRKSFYLSFLGIVLIAGIVYLLTDNNSPDHSAKQEEQDLFKQDAVEVLDKSVEVTVTDDGKINVSNLFIPWTISKNGNTFFLSQRDGAVVKIEGDLGIVEVQDVKLSEEILHEGQGGFLGFTLAPDFESSKSAFAYHTYEKNGEALNRIVSLTLEGNTWKEENALLDGIPGGDINNGGRIQIGPDGMLYATTGDTGEPNLAQEQASLAGKILRMDLNGEIPEDNPFKDSFVYSYGHRNPQGLAWDGQDNLYSSEHGESGHDEINLVKAGKNYGWPVIQGDEEADNMVTPLQHSGDDTWAPAGMAYYDGQLYIASLAGSKIFTYNPESGRTSEFFDDAGRLRDVLVDEDALFTITSNHDSRGEPSEKDDRLIHISLTEKTTGE
ncbi:PQQ-dependent sugar dehydrogenase [Virgibacillus kekensis]|uniref:PQQ-dependent sugar dehydrogenase n=1 Tax=Virgibacillus kekensis TaxID=202261 RepID=A0ABV9DM33_9BACI